MNFRILKGNIIDAKVDAIVLPANTKLKEGSGTSRAIFKAAGRKKLTKKCSEIGYCEMGAAVPTLGYDLDCKTIIHAVVPRWVDGNHDEYNFLSSAYVSALELADVMECSSIAFPLLASGNNGFDLELAFEIAIKNIEIFDPKHLKDVVIVVFGNRAADLAKGKGYEVSLLPRNLERDAEEIRKNERFIRFKDNIKDELMTFAELQLKNGIEYFKDPENVKRVLQLGAKIVDKVKNER